MAQERGGDRLSLGWSAAILLALVIATWSPLVVYDYTDGKLFNWLGE